MPSTPEASKDELNENQENLSQASESTLSAVAPDPNEEHNYFCDDTLPKNVMSPKTALNFAASELDKMKSDHDVLFQENFKLKREIREAEKNRFSFDRIRHSNELVKMHTGLPSALMFDWLFEQLEPHLEDLKYFKGKNSFNVEKYQTSGCLKPGPSRALKPVDELLITLMKLRMNLSHADLAFRFKVSTSLIVSILSTWITFLGIELKSLIRWPSTSNIFEYYPACYKAVKGLVLSIIDCTEVFTDNPSLAEANSKMYSSYKSHTTVKVLIAIGPSGCISFLSQIAGGAMSDQQIVRKSNLLEKFLKTASDTDQPLVILADRGFNINDDLPDNVTIVYPPFKHGKSQFSPDETKSTKVVAHARIHVERVIGRVKEFRIFQSPLPLDFIDLIDHIFTVCCAIVNLNPEVVK